MPPAQRTRARWVSRKERSLWCCDFTAFGADRPALQAEIEASDAVIRQQSPDSLLVAVDLCNTPISPEIAAFFQDNAGRQPNPIHKLAVLGVSRWQRLWYRLTRRVTWPRSTRFFDDYEQAKDWLVAEHD